MKKVYFFLSLIPSLYYAQLTTPNGLLQPTSNPTTGNIGIGTSTPTQRLDVNGLITGGFGAKSTVGILDFNDISNSKSGNGEVLLLSNTANGIPNIGAHYFHTLNFEYSNKNGTGNITQFAIPYSNPSTMDVGVYYRGRYQGSWSNWVKMITENRSGFVGIGTNSPTEKLEIFNSTTTPGTISLRSNRNDAGNVEVGKIVAKQDLKEVAKISMLRGGGSLTGYLAFFTKPTNESSLVESMTISQTGNVGIGTSSPQNKLHVEGNIYGSDFISGGGNKWIFHTPDNGSNYLHIAPWNNTDWGWVKALKISGETGNVSVSNKLEAKEIKVTTTPTADFVFEKDYNLPPLEGVEKHIKEKKHLPEIASAKEMEANGVNVGEFQIKLLQKIEELTLYTIEQNKLNKEQSEVIQKLLIQNKKQEENNANLQLQITNLKKQYHEKNNN